MRSPSRLAAALCVLLALLLAGAAGFWLRGRVGSEGAVRVDSAPVVQAIRKVAKLATVEIEVADVIRYEEVRTIVVFDIPKNATLRLRGTVLGGFDLNDGLRVSLNEQARTLHVELPPPRILSVDARVEWFDESAGWLNPITSEDRTRWLSWSRGALGRAARDAGIAQKAFRHARELVIEVAAAFGWQATVEASSGPGPAP